LGLALLLKFFELEGRTDDPRRRARQHARRLTLKEKTVRNNVSSIFAKL
jgi:hypothetical protein